jgi:hypothetical protein
MLERELTGLRYSYEEAGPIIEDSDPFGWGGTCRLLPVTVQPIQPRRKVVRTEWIGSDALNVVYTGTDGPAEILSRSI